MYTALFHLQYPQLRWPRASHWTPNCSLDAPLLAAVCMHSVHLYLLIWINSFLSALQWKLIPCLLKISTKGSMYIQKTRGLRQSLASHHLFIRWGTLSPVLCCFRCSRAQMISCRTCIRTTRRLWRRRNGDLRSANVIMNVPAKSARGWTATNLTC